MTKPIGFHPDTEVYALGTVVSPVCDPDANFTIMGIQINRVDENGLITHFSYRAHGASGYEWFEPFEIKESLINKNKE